MRLKLKQLRQLENVDVYDLDTLSLFIDENQLIKSLTKDEEVESIEDLEFDVITKIQDDLFKQQQTFLKSQVSCYLTVQHVNKFMQAQEEAKKTGVRFGNSEFLDAISSFVSFKKKNIKDYKDEKTGVYNLTMQQMGAISNATDEAISRIYQKK